MLYEVITLEIIFFEAADAELMRRFSETRRRHPLAQQEGVAAAITRERELVAELKSAATAVIDSTSTNVHQLRQRVLSVVFGQDSAGRLAIHLLSFGFRYGLPLEADMVFDVRFLENPHFVPELKPLTGLDPSVSQFVLGQPDCHRYLQQVKQSYNFV